MIGCDECNVEKVFQNQGPFWRREELSRDGRTSSIFQHAFPVELDRITLPMAALIEDCACCFMA